MNCPKCGKEISGNNKFCTNCGTKINDKSYLIFGIILVTCIIIIVSLLFSAKHTTNNSSEVKHNNSSVKTAEKTPDMILQEIDKLQDEYFKIIKRNDVLLQLERVNKKDLIDLNKLFEKVENKINPNCEFLQKYKDINQKYKINTGQNTVEINDFAKRYYDDVDKLLNETYQAVKVKIPQDEFKKLISSEIQWLKEVQNYQKVFDEQEFGSIGTLMKLDYEINMRNFRTLLLMLYL